MSRAGEGEAELASEQSHRKGRLSQAMLSKK